MQRRPRGIDSLSPAQFAGVTIALSLFAFMCGGIVEAATLSGARAAAPAPLLPVPPEPAAPEGVIEDRGDLPQPPAEASPVERIDGQTAPALELAPDGRVTDGATAPLPPADPDPRVSVIDLRLAPDPNPSLGSPVEVVDGAAPPRSGSVAVLDGRAASPGLGAPEPRAQWGISSDVDVIDGSAAHIRPRTSS
jgi:hypothetical protein